MLHKDFLLKTMLHRAYALNSATEAFDEECVKLRSILSRLDYPWSLIDSVISNFVSRKPSVGTTERNVDESNIIRINLPFKDQVSANSVRRQLRDLSNKTGLLLQPVFVSKKLAYPPCNIIYSLFCLKTFVRVRDHCYGCFVFIVLRQLWILHWR